MTFPLDIPTNFEVQDVTFRLERAVAVNQSPFTFTEQTYEHQGERWVGEISLVPYRPEEAAEIWAFLTKLRGRYGTFLYGDPYFLAAGPTGFAGGTPLVDGGSQTGRTLNVKNFPVGQQNTLRAGDYFQIDTGSSARLHLVTEDMHTDGSGNGTITFEPALKTSPADNTVIIVEGAKGVFRLAENGVERKVRDGVIHDFVIAFEEAHDD